MEKLVLPSLDEIKEASNRLKNIIVHTPLIQYDETSQIYMKPETLQPVKSFKLRGVFNAAACLTKNQRAKGLSTMSSGNTAIALGWTGQYFNIPTKSYISSSTPEIKVKTMESYGTIVEKMDRDTFYKFYYDKGYEKEPYNWIHPWP